MFLLRLIFILSAFGFAALNATNVRAECGGTVQCIGIGPTPAAANLGHHGGPATFTMAFGSQASGTVSAPQTAYVAAVTGPAGAMAMLAPINITGGGAAHFQISGGTCSSSNGPVHGGAQCTIVVAFNPLAVGAFTADVHVPLTLPVCAGCITERVFTVTGTGIIGPPTANSRFENVPYNTPLRIDLATSVGGVVSSVAITTPPRKGTVTISGTVVTYTPNTGYFGPDSIAYIASGSGGSAPPATVTIEVGKPGAPTAGSKSVMVVYETSTVIDLADVVTGVYTSLTPASLPAHGLVAISGSVATYQPAKDYFGEDSFTYTATGPGGTSAPATVSLTISALPPGATAATMQVKLNTPTTLDLRPFVRGSLISRIAVSKPPAHGVVTVDGTRLTYTPSEDFFGTDSLSYQAIGIVGISPPATLSINIVGRPDPARNATVAGLLAAQTETARRFASTQIGNVQRRLEVLHRGEGAGGARSGSGAMGAEVAAAMSNADTFAAEGKGGKAGDLWVGGAIQFGRRDADGPNARRETTSSGVSIGLDRRVTQGIVIGAGLGAARDKSTISDDGSQNRARGASAFIYGSSQPDPNTFIDAMFGAGTIDFSMRRFVKPIATFAEADRSARQMFVSIAAGYEYRDNGVLIAPYARFDYTRDRFKDATERGTGVYSLTYSGQTSNSLRGALGVRAESAQETRFGWTTPRVRAEYQRDFRGANSATISYADLWEGQRYTLNTGPADRNALLLGFGNDFSFRSGLNLAIDYQTTRTNGRVSDQSMRASITQELGGRGLSRWWENLDLVPTKPRDIQVEAGFTRDDNVSRAQLATDKLADQFSQLSLRKLYFFSLSSNTRLVLSAQADGRKYMRFPGLSRTSIDFNGELQFRASADFLAPTYAAFAQVSTDQYQTSLRDGQRYATGVSVMAPMTDRIGAFAKLAAHQRNARSKVFDLREVAASMHIDYSLVPHHAIYLGAEYRRGDNVTSGNPHERLTAVGAPASGGDSILMSSGEAAGLVVEDDAFLVPQLSTVRFKGQTALTTIGYNWSIGPANSIDLSWRRVQSLPNQAADTAIGFYIPTTRIRYTVNQFSVLYLLSF